eukprot:CAMPEP_0113932714 /NCGR_PEP_ID=MMETSP1159-20121227/7263_1 /TAXON_ID=88271 /ORGANISM="Picocystis salinarum" /LENGTH=176 /DNA_ID=CAMNT_0000933847 /DNA_START=376 /DNA_END=903 /DNA_ORIENTATION=+ /assembly_acc=CAM_ASM_000767
MAILKKRFCFGSQVLLARSKAASYAQDQYHGKAGCNGKIRILESHLHHHFASFPMQHTVKYGKDTYACKQAHIHNSHGVFDLHTAHVFQSDQHVCSIVMVIFLVLLEHVGHGGVFLGLLQLFWRPFFASVYPLSTGARRRASFRPSTQAIPIRLRLHPSLRLHVARGPVPGVPGPP